VNTEYETVTNGNFVTDSVWVKGSGWSIANGKATSDGTQTGTSYLYQLASMGASQSQRVTLLVSGYVAGTVKVRLGDSAPASSVTPEVSSNGTHVFTLPSNSAAPYLFLQASSDFQGSIESISVVQLTSDGHVTTWYDQGGTNHATQSTASAQPLIVENGVLITEGGLPALDFDGTDDFLTNSTAIMNNAANAYASVVLSRTSSATNELPLSLPSGVADGRGFDLRLFSGTEAQLSIKTEAGNANANGSFNTASGRNVLLTGTFNSGLSSDEAKFFGNGSLVASASNSGSGIINNGDNGGLFIGRFGSPINFGSHLNGKVKEVIIYVSDQSSNRTGIEKNINDHFNIYS